MPADTKILYLVTQSELGGAQNYIFDLSAAFLKRGFHVSVAAGEDSQGPLFDHLKKINIESYYLPCLKRKINFYWDWLAFWGIVKLIKKVRPDIVHLNSTKIGLLGSLAVSFACLLGKINIFGAYPKTAKIIYTIHGFVLNEHLSLPRKIFYWLSEWLAMTLADHIICVSDYDRLSIIKFKLAPKSKMTVTHLGLDLDNIKFLSRDEARSSLSRLPVVNGRPFPDLLVGTIANFYANKGLIYLIEAAKIITAYMDNIAFMIIGDGRERKKLEQMIRKYGLEKNFFLVGRLDNARQYLKAFDIFVLPSIKEGFPYALLEAQAAGLPIIATAVGGSAEIISHDHNGLLLPARNFPLLAENIINLINNADKKNQLSAAALANSKNFDISALIEKTGRIYQCSQSAGDISSSV